MFIQADENKFINRASVYEVVRYDSDVYFSNSNKRTIGSKRFDSIEEAKDYCEKLTIDLKVEKIEAVAERVENIGCKLGDLLEEMKKIRQVLGA